MCLDGMVRASVDVVSEVPWIVHVLGPLLIVVYTP